MAEKAPKVTVRTPNVPGYAGGKVDAEKYAAMKAVLLKVVPKAAPGVTQKEMFEAARKAAPAKHWPGGEKVEWWAKTVQLDLESRGLLRRDASAKPLRWRRAK